MRKKTKILALAFAGVLAVGALAVAFASATYTLFGNATIVTPGNASAHAAQLTSDATAPGYGGVDVFGWPTDPSAISALSFDFNANVTGASGASPRLVVSFADGGNAQLRPLTLTAGLWVTIDGMSGTNWDNNGGGGSGCVYAYATDWAGVLACHPGASIDGMWVVNDSSGFVVLVDNITVNNDVITFEPTTATMTVVKTSTTVSLTAPGTVTYSYLVTNTGNVTLTGIALTDDNASAVVCVSTTLAPLATTTCSATHVFSQAELNANGSPTAGSGNLVNLVTATSTEDATATATLSIPITQVVQSPVAADKQQCKQGGWQSLVRANGTVFKNQGDCVSYTNNGK